MDYQCDEQDGFDAVAVLLGKASPGDTVSMGAGLFRLTGPLTVPAGVTLRGAGPEATVLLHHHDGPAVQAKDSDDVILKKFGIRSNLTIATRTFLPGSEPTAAEQMTNSTPPRERGLVWIKGGKNAIVEQVHLIGPPERCPLGGIVAWGTLGTEVLSCDVRLLVYSGINFISSMSATAKSNTVTSCGHGISISRSVQLKSPGHATIVHNKCQNNAGAGIVLSSSSSDRIEDNDCCWNESSGLVLVRASKSPEAPSRAVVVRNRCHENSGAGIILYSSESDRIEANDCWGNAHSGVALMRGSRTLTAPSCAVILQNRCHENGYAGIILKSSNSDLIEGNDCWRNGSVGLGLERDAKSPEACSRAVILGNRCYANGGDGIILFSSDSDRIEGNDCWGNEDSGLFLSRDSDSPDTPSHAIVVQNRFFSNMHMGAAIHSSITSCFDGNSIFGNGSAGIRCGEEVSGESSVVSITSNRLYGNHWPLAIAEGSVWSEAGNWSWSSVSTAMLMTPSGTKTSDLEWTAMHPTYDNRESMRLLRHKGHWAELADKLEQSDFENPDGLALFCSGPGRLSDLKRWLGVSESYSTLEADVSPELANEGHANAFAKPNVYRLDPRVNSNETDAPIYHFDPDHGKSLSDRVWATVQSEIDKNARATTLIAACGDVAQSIASVLRDVDLLNSYTPFSDSSGTTPTGRPTLANEFAMGGHRFNQPLVYGYDGRNLLAYQNKTNADLDFLEPLGPTSFRSRLGFVLRAKKFWLVFSATVLVLTLLAWSFGIWQGFEGPWTDVLGAIRHGIIENLQDLQFSDGVTIAITLVTGGLLAVSATFLGLVNVLLPRHLGFHSFMRRSVLRSDRSIGPWRTWMKRRVFGRGDISLIVLRNMQEWMTDDIDALREVVESRPKSKSLIILVEVPSIIQVDRAVLRPLFTGKSPIADAVTTYVVRGKEPVALTIGNLAPNDQIGTILGVSTEPRDESKLEEVTSGIQSKSFSNSDVIPMLVLGSSRFHAMSLTRHVSGSIAIADGNLSEWLDRYGGVYSGSSDFKSVWSKEPVFLNNLIDFCSAATSVIVTNRQNGRDHMHEIIGLAQKREDMATLLRGVIGRGLNEADADVAVRDYVDAMLACGMAFSFDNIVKELSEPRPNPVRIHALLRSVHSLTGDRESIGALQSSEVDQRNRLIVEARERAISSIDTIQISDLGDEADRLQYATIYAGSMSFRPEVTLPEGIVQTDSSLRRCFAEEVQFALNEFATYDRDFAATRVKERLRPLVTALPPVGRATLSETVEKCRRAGKTLAEILDQATSSDAVEEIVLRHKAIIGDTLCTLLGLLASSASTIEERIKLAELVRENSKKLLAQSVRGSVRGYVPRHGISFEDLLDGAHQVFGNPAVFEGEAATHISGFDLVYGSTDSLFDVSKPAKVAFSEVKPPRSNQDPIELELSEFQR